MLANRIAQYSKLPPDVASAVLEIIKKEILAELFESNRDVTIRGFGSWAVYVEAKTSRKGRNPQTGKEVKISAKKVVKFKAGAELAGKAK
jgi:DNA-binding protein HU-beta